MGAPTDEQLIRDFLTGQDASFELLVRRHTQELFQFVLRFTSDTVSAEDVVQETFLQVYHSASSFDTSKRFKPWLFTIGANKARDFLRKRKRRRELPLEAKISSDGEESQRFVDLMASDAAGVDEQLMVDEKRRTVKAAVQNLPDKLREVLILAYYHKLPYKDISQIVDIPVGTVKSRLHAAVVAFRQSYEKLIDQQREIEP